MPVLDFDALAHRYSIEGQELLGCTATLYEAGLVDDRGWTELARQRGSYVHAAVVLHHQGDLDLAALDGVLLPYVGAYLAFLNDSGFLVEASEERVWSATLRCAGTLDLRGRFPDDSPHVTNILDIKTGLLPAHVGYQTAGYVRLAAASVPDLAPIRRRFALNLRDDGSYRLHPLDNQHDDCIFRAALTVCLARRGWLG